MGKYEDAMKLLDEKFGHKDVLISLSTIAREAGEGGRPRPAARLVDAYYEDGAFYVTSYATSSKALDIAANPEVAVCVVVACFTAEGIGENLDWVRDEKSADIMARVRAAFQDRHATANSDPNPNTCLLRIRLTRGMWNNPREGIRSKIDFVNRVAD